MNHQGQEQTALDAIEDYTKAGQIYAEAANEEARLEDRRAGQKQQAILRLINGEAVNPTTNKPHSASSAEAVVETDGEYAAYRKTQRDAVLLKNHNFTAMTAARLRAELAIAIIHAFAPVSA